MDFPSFINANINWYVKMPGDLPPVDPRDEMLPQLCEEEGATLEPTSWWEIVDFIIEMGMYVCWNKSNTMFISQIQNLAGY